MIGQSIELAREAAIGSHGVSDAAFDSVLARSEAALDWLRARHADSGLRLLHLPVERGDIPAVQAAARRGLPAHGVVTGRSVVMGSSGIESGSTGPPGRDGAKPEFSQD